MEGLCLALVLLCSAFAVSSCVIISLGKRELVASLLLLLFVCFVALRPKSTAMGHCGTVSSPNHTFSWAGLNKRITSNSCTYFRL